ncbi:uncharacterized protein PHACADRAFT_116105 [Phanerochaete carnosa HHB-10118-sp]|uniref:DUF4604 domain-containing protein n=1 Tax=Phanerochaete carnosa (strain HHB-10118-sp) TaxID=650164 RepID=K5V599_PHACS|nr:uncharacterized protein PHACADRAFT_116105 [Phanerochaete carnosa HHB-10118-sp]EKM57791.1 hypothetical protein PHACADRAFT_116105 [Phanerochaete carnosa HHB-10118-sp]
MSKEPTRYQYSNKLSYQSNVPAFLQRLQNKVSGTANDEDDDDEYEHDGSGRPPIPRRPPIPTRPDDEPGIAGEDDQDDEAPQIVVLKEGKHLSEREVENEKRKAKGLPLLPEGDESSAPPDEKQPAAKPQDTNRTKTQSLSFSSGGSAAKSTSKKRKAVGSADDDNDDNAATSKASKSGKKPKKNQNSKKLLSFGDDA